MSTAGVFYLIAIILAGIGAIYCAANRTFSAALAFAVVAFFILAFAWGAIHA
jgi:hypothetical protein